MNRTGNGYFDTIEHIVGGVTSIDTHSTPWLSWIWDRHTPRHDAVIIDPFARNCTWGTITNDIDPFTKADYHLDALEFLKRMESGSADAVIFDPPFSARQASEKYESGHVNIYAVPGYVKKCMKEIVRILAPGGILMKCGWNSTRHNLQLEPVALYVVNTGGNHNDISITIWRIGNQRLDI
jgi:hypothetical protein